MMAESTSNRARDISTYDDPDVAFCTVGGVAHDFRPHTSTQGTHYPRTYWRCVWCHGVTCGDYDEVDPCWLPYHHRGFHVSRAGERWPVGGERSSDLDPSAR